MTLGRRVAVMRNGRILQCDRPQRLYAEPANVFIAAFIGSPAMNLVEAAYDGEALSFGQFSVPVADGPEQERVILGVRPESFEDASFARGLPTVSARVEVVEELGSDTHLFFFVDAPPMTAEVLESASEEGLLATDRALFTARVDARSEAVVGRTMELAVDPSRFRYFDPTSGARLGRVRDESLAGIS
jgi:multiple sugar transport system ATP-binding protein